MFEAFRVPFYHAWIYHPESEEFGAIMGYGDGSRDDFVNSVIEHQSSGEGVDDNAFGLAHEIAQDHGFAVTEHGLFTLACDIVQDQYSVFYDGVEFVSLFLF
jgi:hypothetical protein